MTRAKAQSYIRACQHPANRRKWRIELRIEQQGFIIDAARPLTKREAAWWVEMLTVALMKL